MKVTVGVSNRHVHLTKSDLETLFGIGHELTKVKDINQPGQFASAEMVTLKTEKNEIKKVRVLGPIRPYTQVEISKTDAFTLGLKPPMRESGDVVGSAPITLIGPNGTIDLKEGCIIATRHIHATKEDAKRLGLEGIDKVSVRVGGEKGGVMENVSVRVADNSYYEMHIDTDDANAHFISNGDEVEIILPNAKN
ncbi:MAG TPA: phosphate propanoyltransferase [Candidatus Fimihabitans intestinipullorum]|uniref:Phosphate propanoyltransferase n=1 Tax=Candidatus Fimihabitans intestinipullorum TaxID=2840820 RepID=A0A9D1L243_9BACT|nr:phosphate propanoyltransferase [Candidatus Fimihabitans intestinipullorum]